MEKKKEIVYIPGLDGVAPVKSSISSPDTEKGMLFYRGYPIDILTEKANFEEIIYLLLFGKLPTLRQFNSIQEIMEQTQNLPTETINTLKTLGPKTPLMKLFIGGIISLAQNDIDINNATIEMNAARAIILISQAPIITANVLLVKSEIEPIAPVPGLLPLTNFLHILNIPIIDADMERALKVGQMLCCEHEMNASTLAVRTAASAGSDMYSAISSGLGVFAGIYHGGANQFIVGMLQDIGSPDNVPVWVNAKLSTKDKKNRIIMGFGHRVYKGAGGDPRTTIFKEWALRLGKNHQDINLLETAEVLEKYVGDKKNLCANVDFYFALVNHFIGLPAELSPLIYAMARVVGWTAHYIEQFHDPEGKILRPRAIYAGPEIQKWVDIENRR